jgi:hypothetical protein
VDNTRETSYSGATTIAEGTVTGAQQYDYAEVVWEADYPGCVGGLFMALLGQNGGRF